MKYVLFAFDLSGIGGGQQFILRRAALATKLGFETMIVAGKVEPLVLEELRQYHVFVQRELLHKYHEFSSVTLSNTTRSIKNAVSSFVGSEDSIFEAVSVSLGVFANNVAKELKKHCLIYEIAGVPIKKKQFAEFAVFKAERGELIGCSKYCNQILFSKYPDYYDESKNLYVNIPFDNSEILDDTNELAVSKDPNSLKILTVSRIEKEYLIYLIGEVSKVAKVVPNKTVELTMVLNRRQGKEFDILMKQGQNIPTNMKVSFLGPIVPLNKSLFLTHDIFVGVGTASLNAISLGVPTIVADFNSDKSIGILGIDAEDFGYAPIKDIHISQQIQRFLDNPTLFMEASERGFRLYQEEYESSAVMNKFMVHIERIMKQEPEYYSFDKISLSRREKLKKAVMSIAGVKGYDFLVKLYAKRKGYSKPK